MPLLLHFRCSDGSNVKYFSVCGLKRYLQVFFLLLVHMGMCCCLSFLFIFRVFGLNSFHTLTSPHKKEEVSIEVDSSLTCWANNVTSSSASLEEVPRVCPSLLPNMHVSAHKHTRRQTCTYARTCTRMQSCILMPQTPWV